MRRFAALVLALLMAAPAFAQQQVAPNVLNPSNKFQPIKGTVGGAAKTTLEDPDREFGFTITNVFFDTLSNASRRDSLQVPIDVHNVTAVTWMVRMEGAQTAAGGVVRVGFTPRFHSSLVADSLNTMPVPEAAAASNNPWAVPDSVGSIGAAAVADPAVHLPYPGEVVLAYMPHPTATVTNGNELWKSVTIAVPVGAVGASFLLRSLSAPTNTPYRIRVKASGRALR